MIDVKEDLPLKNPGIIINKDFPLPTISSLSRAVGESGLSTNEFIQRQRFWGDQTLKLMNLIDTRIEKLHLTENPKNLRESDPNGYSEAFRRWKDQIVKYGDAIDAQAILSDDFSPGSVSTFLERVAGTAIREGLISPEDCEKLGINLQG